MQPETRSLLKALAALNHKVPQVGLALMEGKLSASAQREFAGLLIELAEQLEAHADGHFGDGDDHACALVIPGDVGQPGINASHRDFREP